MAVHVVDILAKRSSRLHCTLALEKVTSYWVAYQGLCNYRGRKDVIRSLQEHVVNGGGVTGKVDPGREGVVGEEEETDGLTAVTSSGLATLRSERCGESNLMQNIQWNSNARDRISVRCPDFNVQKYIWRLG